jgi:hypothetical protein
MPQPRQDHELQQQAVAAVAIFAGKPGAAVAWFADAATAKAALLNDLARERRGRLLVVGGEPLPRAPFAATIFAPGAFALAKAELGKGDDEIAALVVEPWLAAPDDAVLLWSLLALALAHDVPVVLDETRTAGRAAAGAVHVALQIDAGLVGPVLVTLGAGNSISAAVVGSALAPSAVDATLASGTLPGDHAERDRRGRELRAAIADAATREQLQLRQEGPAAMPRLRFLDQEGAAGSLIDEHFAAELTATGHAVAWPLDVLQAPPAETFARALARIRTKLIEFNSYLSGGVVYPWAGAMATLQQRGLMLYRYPRLAAVRVAPTSGAAGMRIDFAAGELGAVTSSGFYLPTMLIGDIDVEARYHLRRWQSGSDSACFELFLQNLPSTVRYYAQVMNTADRPLARTAAASLAGEVSARRDVPADTGWLRLTRRSGEVIACHRRDASEPWSELGRCAATTDPLFVGAKVRSQGAGEGLIVDVVELRVTGTIAAEQEPLLGARPDPREATGA